MKSSSQVTAVAPESRNILAVTPSVEDHTRLASILNLAASLHPHTTQWKLSGAMTLACAITALDKADYSVVLCESELGIHGWKDLIECTETRSNPPSLIVTSQNANERLWAEALNRGAYDVLAKPFSPSEVIRAVELAGLRWQRQGQLGSSSNRQTAVAG